LLRFAGFNSLHGDFFYDSGRQSGLIEIKFPMRHFCRNFARIQKTAGRDQSPDGRVIKERVGLPKKFGPTQGYPLCSGSYTMS
jgi:hypothetical protein